MYMRFTHHLAHITISTLLSLPDMLILVYTISSALMYISQHMAAISNTISPRYLGIIETSSVYDHCCHAHSMQYKDLTDSQSV